ncbi:MAG: cobyric acid synthase [Chloroflexota bacterium]
MHPAKTLMVQGTSSSAGKSILVTALCRIFRQDGYRVAPFKAQNMALNSFVTAGGGEMGRAQVVQAEAAGIAPAVEMNPVLLKPTADDGSQVIVLGKVVRNIRARDYYRYAPSLLETISASLESLRREYDVVVIEGAGSPAEINLKEREIVNMRIARLAAAPVLLVGDIDRGGVFASLVGTLALLDDIERDHVKGLVINKFRGDLSLLKPGLDFLEERTGKPVLGVVPYFRDIRVAQEDSVYLDERENPGAGDLDIAVIRLPRISNYDDFDPLEEEGCRVRYVRRREELGEPHLIILPGTKSTVPDLGYLRERGLAEEIVRRAEAGTPLVGICGGYQMLGRTIIDEELVEANVTESPGLGLLDVVTRFAPEKSTRQVRGRVLCGQGLFSGVTGAEVTGYEIHMGQTGAGEGGAAFEITASPPYAEGTVNPAGTILGTYLHGLFHNDDFRRGFLDALRRYWKLPETPRGPAFNRDAQYDRLAEIVRGSLDMPRVYAILEAGIGG